RALRAVPPRPRPRLRRGPPRPLPPAGAAVGRAGRSLLALAAACGNGRAPALPDAPPSGWETLAPLPSGPRQETAVVALGGKVYVLGGFDGSGQVVADVAVFDGTGWRRAADLPAALHHMNAAVVGGRIVVAGALANPSFDPVGMVLRYDPSADQWTQGRGMPAGTERGASATAAIGGVV